MQTLHTSRLFVAVPLDHYIKSVLHTLSGELQNMWPFRKWVHPADYHITLQFLGACTFEQAQSVKTELKKAAAGCRAFTLKLDRLGAFGKPQQPRILWAGVNGEADALRCLQTRVATALQPLGFEPGDKPYRPHITLARNYLERNFPGNRRLEGMFAPENADYTWHVKEIVLYRTNMKQTPMYQPLSLFALNG